VPLLLRKIRKSKWYKNDAVSWLNEDENQADALGDLVTSNNTLSVWLVEDDKSNLDQVIVALASTSDNISNLDYALVKVDLLLNIGIKIESKEGLTPYSKANKWHRDIEEMTATKLYKLAEIIFIHSDIARVSQKDILNLIKVAVQKEEIDKAKLKEGIINKIK
jgi:hypothetical protein